MKKYNFILLFTIGILVVNEVNGQIDSLSKTRFVIGLGAPELLHVGVNQELSKFNQIGINAGLGPTWGGVWPTFSIEHKLYFKDLSDPLTGRKWFFRQGVTFFPSGDGEFALTFTFGKDFKSKTKNEGLILDFGGIIFIDKSEYGNNNQFWPALRFQYYTYFKKALK